MIYFDRVWTASTELVNIIRDGVEETQPITMEGRDWWTDYEAMWGTIEVIEFRPARILSELEVERLEEVNEFNIGEQHLGAVQNYVKFGEFPDEPDHPLVAIENRKLKKDLELLQKQLSEL